MAARVLLRQLVGALVGAVLSGAAAEAGTITWARYSDADSLDPGKTTTGLSVDVWLQIYDTLLAFRDDGSVNPNMAKSYDVSSDGKTITLRLNAGIKCSDGADFTSDDVKYTIERSINPAHPSVMKAAWGPISQVETPDASTVVISLTAPFAAFVPFLANPMASMLCKGNERLGDKFGSSTAVGTGPWVLDHWVKGDSIVLRRNPSYANFGRSVDNKGAPYEDELVIKTIPEAQTRLAALRTGSVDIIEPSIEDADALKDDASVKIVTANNTGEVVFLEFATSRPPFNDVRARQAVAHAINAEEAVSIVYGDLSKAEYCPVGRGVLGNDEDFCKKYLPAYDPARAKALLAELGFGAEKPMTVTLMTWTGDGRDKILQVLQNQMKQVGIDARIEIMDIGTLNARVRQENQNKTGQGTMDLMGWNWFDPDILYQLWHSPGAYKGYTAPELDKLLETLRTTTDNSQRVSVAGDVTKHLLSNAVQVPVYAPGWSWLFATRAAITGFKIGPYTTPQFADIKVGR